MAKLKGVTVIDMKDGVPTKIAYEGAEYAVVDGEGLPGDVGLRVSSDTKYASVGSYYSIVDDSGVSFVDDMGDKPYVFGNFVFFRKSKSANLTGKFVVFSDVVDEDLTVGKYYEIKSQFADVIRIKKDGDSPGLIHHDPEKTASGLTYEIHDEKPELNVGDYAKVIGTTYWGNFEMGSIVEVTGEATFEGDYRITLIDGSDYDFALRCSLEKVDLTAEELTFIKIGREPGGFKIGDVAEVVKSVGASPVGTLVEITRAVERWELIYAKGWSVSLSQAHTYMYGPEGLRLIAPVESRVDVSSNDDSDE